MNYTYNIGKYDVTTAQYCDFLNSKAQSDPYGLWNSGMATGYKGSGQYACNIQRSGSSGSYAYTIGSGSTSDVAARGNMPVTYVDYWDACRFANWLNNGQPTEVSEDAATDSGAYTLTADGIANNTVTRNAGATWAVTTENEWYKAAYYDPNMSGGDGYWEYATQSNYMNTSMANYDYSGGAYGVTPVGSYPYASAYGTYDQSGNVWEWTEAVRPGYPEYRIARGASWADTDGTYLGALAPLYLDPVYFGKVGFRVSEMVPEPSSILALFCGVGGTGAVIRRKRRQ